MAINILLLIAAYLLGSIPFGLVLSKLAGYGDIRNIGSGNIGATNVLRTGNKPLALATLLLDGGKGALAVWLGMWLSHNTALALYMGMAAVLGHIFPIWLKFKGGKGVATVLGFYIAASWQIGLTLCLIWLVMAALFRFSSLAALTALAAAPLLTLVSGRNDMFYPTLLLALLVVAKHEANIKRLLKGAEPKIGAKK